MDIDNKSNDNIEKISDDDIDANKIFGYVLNFHFVEVVKKIIHQYSLIYIYLSFCTYI